jgi:hypothetical protein
MHRRALVLGIAVLLIVVPTLAVVFAAAPAAPGKPVPASVGVSVRPDATIGVTPVLLSGSAPGSLIFTAGETVYFRVSDTGDDNKVTVSINDTNASRDGLKNPVATWVVNASTGTYLSTTAGLGYQIPALTYGGNWNITAYGAVGGTATKDFLVRTFQMDLSAPSIVLPGYSNKVQFVLTALPSGAPYTAASSVNLSATYYDGTTTLYAPLKLNISSFGAGVAEGSVSFVLPTNASAASGTVPGSGYVTFEAWANVSSDGLLSVIGYQDSNIAQLNAPSISLSYNGYVIGVNEILPNSLVMATVHIDMSYGDTTTVPAVGIPISFSFFSAGTAVPIASVPGSPPASVTTASTGDASIVFWASPTVFSTSGIDQVNASATILPAVGGAAATYSNVSATFSVLSNGLVGVSVNVEYTAPEYYGGQSGSATWSIDSPGTHTWTAERYEIDIEADQNEDLWTTYQVGTLSGTSGTIAFSIPQNFTGYWEVIVIAHNATLEVSGSAYAQVLASGILISPSTWSYAPGSTVVCKVTTEGSGFTGATLYYTVSSGSAVFASGTVANDSFSIGIPSSNVPDALVVTVVAQSPTLGVFATSQVDLYESGGYSLTTGISTVSKYSDGTFQPGQTITITWSYHVYGTVVAFPSFVVSLWTSANWFYDLAAYYLVYPPIASETTSSTSGSFQYTIPSGTGAGIQSFMVDMEPTPTVTQDGVWPGEALNATPISFDVNPSPSALNYEIGAGSGLTVGWLILLVVIVVVAVVLVLLIRRGRSPRGPASTYRSSEPMSPPAPAPSTSPAAEWKEGSGPEAGGTTPPAGSGDSQPPLPTPPSGSQ